MRPSGMIVAFSEVPPVTEDMHVKGLKVLSPMFRVTRLVEKRERRGVGGPKTRLELIAFIETTPFTFRV
jgi:hypothetical protein